MSNPRDGDDIEYNDNEENELALSEEEEEEEDNKVANMEEEDKEEEEERLIKKAKAKAAKENRDEEEEDESMGWQDDDDDMDDDDEDEMMYGDTAEGDEEDEEAQDSSSNRDEEDDEGEEEEDDHPHGERYLQKLDERLKKDYLQEIHPEAFLHNYEEVMSLSQITRDENYRIIDPLHKTLPFLTKYERTRLLGMRAKQINAGATPLVEVPETMLDGQLIAERELQERKLPFVLRRPLPNGTFEYWRVSDLELL